MAEAELAPLSPAELDSVQSLVQNTLASASSHLANDFDDPATFLRLPSHLHAVEQLLSDYTVLENLIPNELYRTTLHRIDETLELLLDRERAGPDPVFPLRPPVYRTAAGRTALAVERDVMVGLAADGLTNAEMALVLGVSLSTVKRRRKKYGLGREHTPPTQEEVDRIVKEVVEDGNQAVGEVLLLGMLRARGQGHLPRKMVRETLRGLDRQRVVDRWMKAIKRRRYSVPFPNSLWHIDGESFSSSSIFLPPSLSPSLPFPSSLQVNTLFHRSQPFPPRLHLHLPRLPSSPSSFSPTPLSAVSSPPKPSPSPSHSFPLLPSSTFVAWNRISFPF